MNAGIFYTMAGSWAVALKSLGVDMQWHVVSKDFHKVFAANFPEVPQFEDEKDAPTNPDMIVGSPPCIGMSVSNPAACLAHPANMLTLGFASTVAKRRPLGFIMEMVPTFLGPKYTNLYNEYKAIIGSDYSVKADVVNFLHYGVPQVRKRAIIMGVRSDLVKPAVFPIPFSPEKPDQMTVREAFSGLPQWTEEAAVREKLTRKFNPKWKGPYSLYLKGEDKLKLKWDEPAPTVVAINTTYWKHPDENRLITWQEAARLQEFPDDYKFIGSYPKRVKLAAWGVPCRGIAFFIGELIQTIWGE